jgi:hypothetical protein
MPKGALACAPTRTHAHTHTHIYTHRQYVSVEDFDFFFPDDPELSRRAFRVFDVS